MFLFHETLGAFAERRVITMIDIKNKSNCCGCSACMNVCPVKAIDMMDDEQGFLYPYINSDKCISCNRCSQVCPIESKKDEVPSNQRAFLIQNKDKKVLSESASGGAFSAIAETIIDLGGVVFGAAYDENFNVVHTVAETKTALKAFRNSKYVQSDLGLCFQKVKEYISSKRYVCFSGTPCQIEGLLNYLGKESQYLYTVDIVCHAVPSPKVWKTYIQILNNHGINPVDLRFRDKDKYGYLYSQFKIEQSKKKTIYQGIDSNMMLKAFFSEICNRPSCYECKFKKVYRRSDMTMWDCFDLVEFTTDESLNQNAGISRLLVHSEKGAALLEYILPKCNCVEISVENALHFDSKELSESVKKNEKYDDFWKDFILDPEKTLMTYFGNDVKSTMERIVRIILFKTRIYPWVRANYKKIFGNKKR